MGRLLILHGGAGTGWNWIVRRLDWQWRCDGGQSNRRWPHRSSSAEKLSFALSKASVGHWEPVRRGRKTDGGHRSRGLIANRLAPWPRLSLPHTGTAVATGIARCKRGRVAWRGRGLALAVARHRSGAAATTPYRIQAAARCSRVGERAEGRRRDPRLAQLDSTLPLSLASGPEVSPIQVGSAFDAKRDAARGWGWVRHCSQGAVSPLPPCPLDAARTWSKSPSLRHSACLPFVCVCVVSRLSSPRLSLRRCGSH